MVSETIQIVNFVLVSVGVLLGVFSSLYLYKFIKSYSGVFKRPIELIFYSSSVFTLLVIEFGTYGLFGKIEIFSFILSLSSVVAFILMLEAAVSIKKSEKNVKLEILEERKKLLEKKVELLKNKFFQRKIDEAMFKDLLKDLEKEIVDIEAQIEMEKEG